jgi:hypothetical protein
MKYWAYVNNEILGPFEKEKLLELPSFAPSLLVCPQTPVGEKTEDWKEAATYPELSALIGAGGMKPSAAPAPAPAPAAAPSPAPATETPAHTFKPLSASSIDPVAPAEHNFGGPQIAVNHLGKAGGGAAPEASPAPAVSQPHQSAPAFDPISLSRIDRKGETLTNINAAGIAKEPHQGFGELPNIAPIQAEPPAAAPAPAPAPAPAVEPISFAQGAAPVLETFARPAAAAPAFDKAASDALTQKLDTISRASVTKQDLAAAIDPFRQKLDQIGEMVNSMKNAQFQREVMDKLAYLENAISDIKSSMRSGAGPAQGAAPAAQPQMVIERNSDTVFGVQPRAEKPAEKPKEKAKEEPKAKEKAPAIVDTGSKRSSIGPMLGKLVKGVVTIVLLVAALFVAVIVLKNTGVFDATKFIPFQLPFVGGRAQAPETPAQPAPEAGTQQAPAQPQSTQPAPGAQPGQAQAQQAKTPDISPEIIYFTRTYKAPQGTQTLEDGLVAQSAAAGGEYAKVNWQVKPAGENVYEISAIIPSGQAALTYTFVVDYGRKTLLPGNDESKAVLGAITPRQAPARGKVTKGRRKGAAGAAQAAQPGARQPAAKGAKTAKGAAKQGKAQDEYEYVYEDDDGTGK